MKDKLEPNMYVRTKDGVIGKLKNKNYVGYGDFIIDTLYYNFDEIIDKWTCIINKYDIEKASHNIIDLIEAGDVITTNNLCGEITKIDIENNKIWIACCDYETCSTEDIKSIVTHEQMKQMAYKVGE